MNGAMKQKNPITNDTRRYSKGDYEMPTKQGTEYSGLTRNEIDLIKEQFIFYDKHKTGQLDNFELRMVLDACGYKCDAEKLKKLHENLEEKNIQKIDINALLVSISYLKELKLNDEELIDNEYVDAFVALGGEADRSGTISKTTLIRIIKAEFELTIDMEEYLHTIGGQEEHINFFQFCMLLDAGTGGNPSRVSSVLTNRTMSFL